MDFGHVDLTRGEQSPEQHGRRIRRWQDGLCLVILPVTPSRLLDRTMIYTALTRAVETIVLVGDPEVIGDAASTAPKTVSRPQDWITCWTRKQTGSLAHLDQVSSGNGVALSEVKWCNKRGPAGLNNTQARSERKIGPPINGTPPLTHPATELKLAGGTAAANYVEYCDTSDMVDTLRFKG